MSRLSDLRSVAGCFDLSDPADRNRSARELGRLYLDLVTEIRPTVTAEIGAFEATFSTEMKRRLPGVTAVAFEANPYNFESCSARAREAGVEYIHAAVADVDGALTFNLQTRYANQPMGRVKGNDSLLTRTAPDVEYEEVTVPALTAGGFFAEPRFADGRICLWVDVEGAAGKVLQGAGEVFDRVDAILIELENYPFWAGQWLAGEVDSFLQTRGLVPIARDFEYAHQFNAIYVKPAVTALHAFDYLLTTYHSRISRPRPL